MRGRVWFWDCVAKRRGGITGPTEANVKMDSSIWFHYNILQPWVAWRQHHGQSHPVKYSAPWITTSLRHHYDGGERELETVQNMQLFIPSCFPQNAVRFTKYITKLIHEVLSWYGLRRMFTMDIGWKMNRNLIKITYKRTKKKIRTLSLLYFQGELDFSFD